MDKERERREWRGKEGKEGKPEGGSEEEGNEGEGESGGRRKREPVTGTGKKGRELGKGGSEE